MIEISSPPEYPTYPADSLKAKVFALGEWYSCRGLALVASSEISILRFNFHGP